MSNQSTRVPAAVDALVAMGAAIRAAGLVHDVFDGPTPTGPTSGTTPTRTQLQFFVGSPAADVTLEVAPGYDDMYLETAMIGCAASSWSGDRADAKTHRDVCLSILDEVKRRLYGDPTLGGVVEHAFMGQRMRWPEPTSDDRGYLVEVGFTVRVRSYI